MQTQTTDQIRVRLAHYRAVNADPLSPLAPSTAAAVSGLLDRAEIHVDSGRNGEVLALLEDAAEILHG